MLEVEQELHALQEWTDGTGGLGRFFHWCRFSVTPWFRWRLAYNRSRTRDTQGWSLLDVTAPRCKRVFCLMKVRVLGSD